MAGLRNRLLPQQFRTRDAEHSGSIRCYPKTPAVVEEKAVQATDLEHRQAFAGTFWKRPFMGLYLAFGHSGGFRANGRADGPDIAKVVRQPYRAVQRLGDRGRPDRKYARRFKSL